MALNDGRVSAGLDTLRLALQRDWKLQPHPRASAWSNLAAGCLSAGRFQEAHDAAVEALRLDPSLQAARDNLSIADGALHALGSDAAPAKR